MRTEPVGTEIECSKCVRKFVRYRPKERVCRPCMNKHKREYEKKFRKTKKGFVSDTYRGMRSRVRGDTRKKAHLYLGLEILSRDEFLEWTDRNPDFHKLFKEWEESGYEKRLTPSIDRINPHEGYYLLNMEWTTFSQNSRRGAIMKHYGRIV